MILKYIVQFMQLSMLDKFLFFLKMVLTFGIFEVKVQHAFLISNRLSLLRRSSFPLGKMIAIWFRFWGFYPILCPFYFSNVFYMLQVLSTDMICYNTELFHIFHPKDIFTFWIIPQKSYFLCSSKLILYLYIS